MGFRSENLMQSQTWKVLSSGINWLETNVAMYPVGLLSSENPRCLESGHLSKHLPRWDISNVTDDF